MPWAPGLRRCPWSVIGDEAWRYVAMWKRYRALSILPEHGDILDQPGDIAQAIEVAEWTRIDVERARHEQEEAERRKRERK